MKKESNYAFIDSQNLICAMREIGWNLDYSRFFTFLSHKFRVTKAFIFIGYKKENFHFYQKLCEYWFEIIFKPTLKTKSWVIKGNCDAELVLHAMIHYAFFDKAIIVSWDWDFYCLIDYLVWKGKFKKLLIPRSDKYSALLRKFTHSIFYLNGLGVKDKITKNGFRNNKKSRRIDLFCNKH